MIYILDKDILVESDLEKLNRAEQNFVCIFTYKELEPITEKVNINNEIFLQSMIGRTSKFESYNGFDYISLIVPNIKEPLKAHTRIGIFFEKNILTFVCDDKELLMGKIQDITNGTKKCTSLGKILHIFLDRLTSKDTYELEKIEQEISNLEEGLIKTGTNDYLNKIIILRKRLLKLKRYYEQFYDVAEGIEENSNDLIDKKTIKSLKMITSRVNRLYQSVINLRDYVSQVREAYQAQIDINQNNIMKIFTVITSIFLPLTLIVGWYGMNLQMPEYNWNFGYIYVIILSIIVISICFGIFKKKKWF